MGTTLFQTIISCSYYIVRQRKIMNKQALCIQCTSAKRSRDIQLLDSTKTTSHLKPINECSLLFLTELRTKSREKIYWRDTRIKKATCYVTFKESMYGDKAWWIKIYSLTYY